MSSPLSCFYRAFGRKVLRAAAGLFLFAFGIYTQLAAGVGTSPWNVLNDGLARLLHMSFGQASIIISLLIVLADLLLGETVGLGTLMDAFLIGWWVDMFVWLDFLPVPATVPGKALLLIGGVVVICFGQFLYMGAGLACGPRDALMVAVGKRLPRIPIGWINILLMAIAMTAGALMGGVTGFGTILTMVCMGVCMDLVFNLMKFEPRSVDQQSLLGSWRSFCTARAQSRGE